MRRFIANCRRFRTACHYRFVRCSESTGSLCCDRRESLTGLRFQVASWYMATAEISVRKKVWTDDELEALPKDGCKYELLDGNLIMSPVHANHGAVCVRLVTVLSNFVRRHKLGEVY